MRRFKSVHNFSFAELIFFLQVENVLLAKMVTLGKYVDAKVGTLISYNLDKFLKHEGCLMRDCFRIVGFYIKLFVTINTDGVHISVKSLRIIFQILHVV